MITVVGLGPGGLDRVPGAVRDLLLDPGRVVVARTIRHPAAEQLAGMRHVVACDDLYEAGSDFAGVYEAITRRVLEAEPAGNVVYAVPGSPMIGEFAVRRLLESGAEVEVIHGESFVDALLALVGYDPLDRGLSILNGHALPDPLVLDKPTVVAHLDGPEVLAEVCSRLGRVLPEESPVTVVVDAGSAEVVVKTGALTDIDPGLASLRTSMFIDTTPGGLIGAVETMRRLRDECPWDREQTHQSLVKNLLEESYELVEAISRLPEGPDPDWVAYAAVEDELGDVLLQVLFHEAIGRQAGAFDVDDVGEVLRQKLVRRHPHVFGDVEASTPEEVKRNWDRIKEQERADERPRSLLDGIPHSLPGLQRAAKVQNRAAKAGFDWESASQVLPKVHEELAELEAALGGEGEVESEVGDVIFSLVNLVRHLGVDPEVAVRRATERFERRFRVMEAAGPLAGLELEQLNQRWEAAKAVERSHQDNPG